MRSFRVSGCFACFGESNSQESITCINPVSKSRACAIWYTWACYVTLVRCSLVWFLVWHVWNRLISIAIALYLRIIAILGRLRIKFRTDSLHVPVPSRYQISAHTVESRIVCVEIRNSDCETVYDPRQSTPTMSINATNDNDVFNPRSDPSYAKPVQSDNQITVTRLL